VLLDGLAAMNLLKKKQGQYRNSPVAQEFLVEGTPTYLGTVFYFMNEFARYGVENMSALVKNGPPEMPSEDFASEDMWAQYARTGANDQRVATAQQAVEIVRALPEFLSINKMLDLGSGAGLCGIAVVAAHPEMKGVLFDQPYVTNVAQEFIQQYEMQNRVETMAGDYMQDSIGEGYDLIWASSTLNFAKDNIDIVMKKIYDALNPGGVFVSLSDGLTDEKTKPEAMLISMIPVALTSTPMSLDQGFLADAMQRAGFKTIRSRTIDTEWGEMDLDIGRKSKDLFEK
jgi:predicted O-methyltransferase YrrM